MGGPLVILGFSFFFLSNSLICLCSCMIGVAGGAASGKTTVCDMIIQQLHDQRVVLVNQVMFQMMITYFDFSVAGKIL